MEGVHLGPYHVLAELGSGGMGTVYLGTCAQAAAGLEQGTRVALKVIHPHLLGEAGFFKRFLREARIGQQVQHENVVRTFDCDATLVDGRQQNFLVMEYVEGQTLRALLDELERVPEELCRHIGREVAQGLAAIHEAGAVHRDLKPENVLITPDHVVKVMDLGVARLQDEAIRLSQTGAFIGSVEYAAPEQFHSSDGEPDGRADLHALGVVLYELATGQHPYRDEQVSKVLHRILLETPRKAGDVNPQLSAFFEEIVHTLIAKARDERFGSAAQLAAVLAAGEASDWWRGRAQALRVETKRPLRRIRIPRETALYGRDDDLARLHALFGRAKAGDGQVLLLEGEAGIGKTRLVDEFVGRLRQEGEDVNFLFGSYPPGGAATAAGAFSEAYREQFGAEGLEVTLGDYLKPTPVLVPAFAAFLKGEPSPKGAEPLTKESLQTVFVHATRALSAERTTIVLIDDLHFSPEEGRALFASLALAAPGHRILLVGTMRPGLPEAWIANLERLEHAERRPLARLGPKDLIKLLQDSFRSERLALDLAGRIAVKCDGNPFFAFEIIRGLREGQFIAQQPDGTWVTTQVIEDIQVPSSVLDLVQARIGDLDDDERNLLDVAACSGFEFDPLLPAQVLGVPEIPALQRLARIEKRHRLVRSAGTHFVFDHHQVQEALYGGLPELLRQRYHAAIADALAARAGAADQDPRALEGALCVDLCEHLLRGAQGEKALRYLDAALDHLEAAYLNDQVVALVDRTLGVPGLLAGAARVEAMLRKSRRLDLLGRRQAQEAVLEEAAALAAAEGDEVLRAKVAVVHGTLLSDTGRMEEAQPRFEFALATFREAGDRQGEALAAGGLCLMFHRADRSDESIALAEQALAIAREIGDRKLEANVAGNLGGTLWTLGRLEEASVEYRRQLDLGREVGDRRNQAAGTANLGNVYYAQGRFEEARAQYEAGLAIQREIGNRAGEVVPVSSLGSVYTALGRTAEARLQFERALEIAREVGDRRREAVALVNLGPIWIGLGAWERSREALETSIALCREVDARYPEGYGLYALAILADEQGQVDEARRLAHESLALRREIRHEGGVVDSLLVLGELELREGNVEAARAALEEAQGRARAQGSTFDLVDALALLAMLPGGDPAAAEAAFDEAEGWPGTPQVRYHLWKATGKREHLAEAKRLLDARVENAPPEFRASMLENVRLNRAIMAAWAEHGAGDD